MRSGKKFDKLKRDQKSELLKWISAELSLKEISRRAAAFKSPFKVTRQQVNYYRGSRGLNADQIIADVFDKARAAGFAVEEM